MFLRQLRSNRERLETTRRMLENARQQPEIQLIQRAMLATSEHIGILVEKPYLRPYFYNNKDWTEGDRASIDEVKAMAELLLDNLASAIIHSAAFPQYPIRGVEQTIRFHLRNSPPMRDFLFEAFDRFPLAGLALLSLKNESKAQTESGSRAADRLCRGRSEGEGAPATAAEASAIHRPSGAARVSEIQLCGRATLPANRWRRACAQVSGLPN